MRPRNKFEKAVLAESRHLRPISKRQLKWAFRECVDHYAYRLPKGRTTCMDCGHTWQTDGTARTCTCPHCKARLQVKNTLERKLQQKQYFTILTTCGEFQVLRMFLLIVEMEKGCKATPTVLEIGGYWWNRQGKRTIVAIQRTLGRYIDTFTFASPMAIRGDNLAYQHIAHMPLCPEYKVVDELRRNGFRGDFHDIVPTKLIPALLSDSRAETLIKAGQHPMLRHYLNSSCNIENYWASVKICIRNGYTISDGSMWRDTIDLLRHFGKDTNSPKYVCPSDLKAEHDRLMHKRNKEIERKKLEERIRQAKKHEKAYRKLKGIFFGIAFTDGTLQVRVLESVAEFAAEGTELDHCVFSNSYFLEKNSLILSATIDGKRIETVEVSLKTLEVVQSRGLHNSNTEYHDRIVNLVNSNVHLIRQRMEAA